MKLGPNISLFAIFNCVGVFQNTSKIGICMRAYCDKIRSQWHVLLKMPGLQYEGRNRMGTSDSTSLPFVFPTANHWRTTLPNSCHQEDWWAWHTFHIHTSKAGILFTQCRTHQLGSLSTPLRKLRERALGPAGYSLFGGVRQLILSPSVIALLDSRIIP